MTMLSFWSYAKALTPDPGAMSFTIKVEVLIKIITIH